VVKFSSRPSTAGSAGVLGVAPTEVTTVSTPGTPNRGKWDDKLTALRSQRRAQGLCMKCGGKWGRGRKCPDQIPLHIMEEVLDAMSIEDTSTDEQEHLDSSSDEEVLSLSWSAHEGIQGRKTIRLQGLINNQEILLLVDSGSSSTFISAAAVHRLQFQT